YDPTTFRPDQFSTVMLTPYGHNNAFLMLGIGACLLLLALSPVGTAMQVILIAFGVLTISFTLWFFRDAERPLLSEAATNPALIMSPADGQVVNVDSVAFSPELGGAGTQISIFLSPLNLHVNRYPASGTILEARYIPGAYLMAFNPKSSTENERSIFVLENAVGRIAYQQITGFLARRIVYDTQVGDVVTVGKRFGMMKFGSRMDVVVPASADVFVRPGDKVISAHTILARLRSATA
ncbi:MAG: phosphatidylserine decarboxylase, partial [Candidatus Kapabacteria bacterium]|nr:phosphatidylserine decarboxylase [Candidatus Kapabacteria bacterium]